MQCQCQRLGQRQPREQQGRVLRGRLDPLPADFRQPDLVRTHGDDRVGHHEVRHARARLPDHLQPDGRHGEPVPGSRRLQLPRSHLRHPHGPAGDRRRCRRRQPVSSRCSAAPSRAVSAYCYANGSGFTGDKSRTDHDHLHGDRANPVWHGAATSPRAPTGARQLGRRDLRLAVPHAADRSRRLRRQPGPLALRRRGHLPGLDHDHQGRDAGRLDVLRVHGITCLRWPTSRSWTTAPPRTRRSSPGITNFTTYTVAEAAPAGPWTFDQRHVRSDVCEWRLTDRVCGNRDDQPQGGRERHLHVHQHGS